MGCKTDMGISCLMFFIRRHINNAFRTYICVACFLPAVRDLSAALEKKSSTQESKLAPSSFDGGAPSSTRRLDVFVACPDK